MYKKKSLGQHFLQSAAYLRAVADAAGIEKNLPAGRQGELVLEIGPGEGALTAELLARGAHVIAIEKDHRLIAVLTEKFAKEIANKKFALLEGDALWIDISIHILKSKKYKVVGNIPYYITGALIRKYLTEKHQPTMLVFLVQKEVAERITGHPSTPLRVTKESILSLSVKAYGTPVYVKTVPRGAFAPAPSVDSAILLVKNISRKNFVNTKNEGKFFTLVKAGFAQKRKLLKRNIEKVLGNKTTELMEKAGIPAQARAEDVALEAWLLLSKY